MEPSMVASSRICAHPDALYGARIRNRSVFGRIQGARRSISNGDKTLRTSAACLGTAMFAGSTTSIELTPEERSLGLPTSGAFAHSLIAYDNGRRSALLLKSM